jgi:hypothetical protein
VASTAVLSEDDPGVYVAMFVAPALAGTYSIRWQGPEPDQTVSEPLIVTRGLVPNVSDVGALLRARTKTSGGAEVGTFTQETRPTAVEVGVLIDEAVEDVTSQIGVPAVGSALEGRARRAATLYAAVLVELSYFPEQVQGGRSPADTYLKLYKDRMKALVLFVTQGGDDGDADGASGSGDADLSFATQVVVDGVVYGTAPIGWGTRW